MNITLNGQATIITARTVDELLQQHKMAPIGIAVARNGAVVPRSQWTSTPIVEGDAIEIVQPLAGG